MLKIGEFSRLSQVSVKTLRYYDQMGLLKPCHVDFFTNYRYYSFDQLPRLNRILALKDLGLSLEQISQMLENDLSAQQIRRMLHLKQTKLQRQVQQMQAQARRVEARLRLIEMEGKMPTYEVVLKTVEPQLVVSRREVIPSEDLIGPTLDRTFDEASAYVEQHGMGFVGPGIAVWHHGAEKKETDDWDAEAAIPIQRSVAESDRIKVRELPKAVMACVVHHGNFSGFAPAYKSGFDWIKANGYQVVAPIREVYLQYDRSNLDNAVTEIQFPVEKG